MESAIKKADVLIEALPYIKSYTNKIVIIKYGGSSLVNPDTREGVLEDIVFMSFVGIRPILVHGGGPFINEELRKVGRAIKFSNGLRVTTKEDIGIIDKILNNINHKIADDIRHMGARSVSLNAEEKGIIIARPHRERSKLGYVGEVEDVDKERILKAVRPRSIPVISPVSIGNDGELYNVNADDIACKIAISLKAAKLVLLTDVKGIMRQKGDESSLISTMTMKDAELLINRKIIQSGMIPKVYSCIEALKGGVGKTHIIDGGVPHSLLLEIFTDRGIGTEIIRG